MTTRPSRVAATSSNRNPERRAAAVPRLTRNAIVVAIAAMLATKNAHTTDAGPVPSASRPTDLGPIGRQNAQLGRFASGRKGSEGMVLISCSRMQRD